MITKLQGILTDKFPTEQITPNFSKRVFWLVQPDTERNPQHWQIELHNDDGKRLDAFGIGDQLEAEVEVRGKKWSRVGKDGIITSLKCIGLAKLTKPIPRSSGGTRRRSGGGFDYPEMFS